MTNKTHSTFYVGVTSDLLTRITEHKEQHNPKSFTFRYNVTKLVYFENFHSIEEAILCEKRFKGGSRQKKIDAINVMNPGWIDLYDEILNW